MRDWREELRRGLEGLRVGPERLGDLVEELAQHLDERSRTARAAGDDDEAADTKAWEALGSLTDLRTRLEREHGESAAQARARATALGQSPPRSSPLGGLGQDLRHAARALRKSPGFTAVALATLALGIGASTTLFSLINALFLTPLPLAQPGRAVLLYTSDYSGPRYGASSYPDFQDVRDEPRLFESLAAYSYEAVALTTDREPARVFSELVSGGFFETLSLPVAQGRPLGPEDDLESAEPAVVISHGLWQRRLAGAPSVLGRSLTLSGVAFTVVGIASPGFTGLTRGVAAEAWVPLAVRPRLVPGNDSRQSRGSRFLSIVGRLAPGVGPRDAQARLDVLATQFRTAYPEQWTDRAGDTRRLTLLRESEARISPMAKGSALGFSALVAVVVALVLLIACANVANLMLARVSTRRREIAVRLALGASRARVIRHFLAESVLVTSLGGALGVVLTVWACHALRTLSLPLPVPVHLEVLVDGWVLAFALALTLATGLLLGLAPALHAASPDLVPALKDEGGGVASGARGRRLRRLFVAAQVALSMVLLVGASLLLRGIARATHLAPGFEVEKVHLVPVDLGLAGYEVAQAASLIDRLADRLPPRPGASAAALTMALPLELHLARRDTRVDGYVPQSGEEMEFYFGVVGPGHFDALRIPILRGREFTPADCEDAPGVVIVNETFAARFWPGQDPIGRTVQVRGEDGPRLTVVGLAHDSKYRTLSEPKTPFYYLPILQDYGFVKRYARLFPLHVVIGGEGDLRPLTRAATATLRAIDPKLPVYPPKSMIEHLGVSVLPSRVASGLFATFGLVGLLLASLGLYGIVAYAVAQRTREIGVRIALGASHRDVLRLVLRDGLGLTASGAAVGAVLALLLAQAMRTLLYGLSPLDPVTFLLVPLLLATVALAASALPARRAARVDPAITLRYE